MYSTAEAADALGISAKRLDNILVGPARELVPAGVNGRSRSIRPETIELIAVALLLSRDLGVAFAGGIDLAGKISTSDDGVVPVGTLGSLHFDLGRLRSVLQNALGDAVEDRLQPRRGRPPTLPKKKRGASL